MSAEVTHVVTWLRLTFSMDVPWSSRHTPHVYRLVASAFILVYSYQCLAAKNEHSEDYLLCRQCGHEVAKAEDLVRVTSTLAERQRNETILGVRGVLIQMFENPQARKFEVITSRKADVFKDDKAYAAHSWFPGFSWRISVCPRCGFHLGWSFEPQDHKLGKADTEKTFIGLILDSLLHQDYADSLLIIPKSYRS